MGNWLVHLEELLKIWAERYLLRRRHDTHATSSYNIYLPLQVVNFSQNQGNIYNNYYYYIGFFSLSRFCLCSRERRFDF